jgi:NitT/TauT family transport system substrate-binding protein
MLKGIALSIRWRGERFGTERAWMNATGNLQGTAHLGRRDNVKAVIILLASALFLTSSGLGTCEAAGEPIRLGYLQSDIHQLASWVALEKGYFREEGLKVEVAGIFKAGPEEMSAFAANALDVGYVGEAPSTTAVANGAASVTVLAQVNTEGSAIIVREGSTIKDVQALLGKTVAIPGHSTVQDFLLRKALVNSGIDPNQVHIIVLKPPEMIGALRTGQIDAFIAWEPYPAKAQTMGVGRVLVASNAIWPDHPCCVLIADNRFLASHPDEAKAMVRAHVKATDFIHTHPEVAAEIGVKYSGMDERTVQLAIKSVTYTYALSIEGEKEYVEFLSQLKYIKIDDAAAFVKRFINPVILQTVVGKAN